MANKVVAAVVMAVGIVGIVVFKFFRSKKDDPLPLDMALNAVDDMYAGCEDKMENKVRSYFLLNERKTVKNFNQVWNKAEEYFNSLKPGHEMGHPTTLDKEQIMAIHAYTLENPKIYDEFNDAVRKKRSKYKTSFKYHTLHFFLTTALQTLNKHAKERCLTVYRRVGKYFSQDVLNKEIRFGAFTSSSKCKYPCELFGNKTCFAINTCFGADISLYSKFGKSEREVLIPPYEVFNVTKIKKKSEQEDLPCEFVYEVNSTRTHSNLNCSLSE